jgi:hypothetical protein
MARPYVEELVLLIQSGAEKWGKFEVDVGSPVDIQ